MRETQGTQGMLAGGAGSSSNTFIKSKAKDTHKKEKKKKKLAGANNLKSPKHRGREDKAEAQTRRTWNKQQADNKGRKDRCL